MKFNMPKDQSSIIKVIGVGGGGSNAVNHMFQEGIKGVDFVVCNTDAQALDISPVPIKIQLGSSLTEGRGAGSIPDVGKNAAIENIDEIKEILANNTKMVFVTAGMGGGTGTGAAPVIAKAAKEMGILTVGIVTVPFSFEGKKRRFQADSGVEAMRNAVDTLLIINNDKLREMFGNLTLANAFGQADDVLTSAAKGIAEVISVTGQINVDFNDVNTVMRDSGVAIMGSAFAEGDHRAEKAVKEALSSPLLNDNDIAGARYVLLNITYGSQEVLMDEITEITDYIQDEAGMEADVIWGHGHDDTLGEKLGVTIVATGFNQMPDVGVTQKMPEQIKRSLHDEVATNITEPVQSPTESSLPRTEAPVVAEVTPVAETPAEPFLRNEEEVAPAAFNFTPSERKEEVEVPEVPVSNFNPTSSVEGLAEEVNEEVLPTNNWTEVERTESVEPISSWSTPVDEVETPEVTSNWSEESRVEEAPVENTWVEPTNEVVNETEETDSQASFTFDMTSRTEEAPVNEVETPKEDVTRYVLEDDLESSPLDTWVENSTAQPVDNSSIKEEEVTEVNDTWEPTLKSEEEQPEALNESNQWREATPPVNEAWSAPENKTEITETPKNTWSAPVENKTSDHIAKEDQGLLAEERIARIKQVSQKLKTPSGLSDLENEPAYKRRAIKLEDVKHSTESQQSRLSLGEDEEGEGRTGLKSNNSFLHDNVD